MEKYNLLFNFLKKSVGPDPARMIIYDVYCDDLKRLCKITGKKIVIPFYYKKYFTNPGDDDFDCIEDEIKSIKIKWYRFNREIDIYRQGFYDGDGVYCDCRTQFKKREDKFNDEVNELVRLNSCIDRIIKKGGIDRRTYEISNNEFVKNENLHRKLKEKMKEELIKIEEMERMKILDRKLKEKMKQELRKLKEMEFKKKIKNEGIDKPFHIWLLWQLENL